MEIARDETGIERSVGYCSLLEAKQQLWTCATCTLPVPVVAAKWPCARCTISTPAKECRHLPYYFRAKLGHFHVPGCPEHQESFQAAVDVVPVRKERGSPDPHPSLIDFDPGERISSASPTQLDEDGQWPHRTRHIRRGEVSSVSQGSSTARDIFRASEFFISHPDSRDLPLNISGMDHGVDRYRSVFKNVLKFDAPIGRTRIWWGRVDLRAPPVEQGSLLTFHMDNGRDVVVDMAGWGQSASSFREFVSTAYDDAKRARQAQAADEWTELLLFCFGELDETMSVRIAERRKFHLIVEVGRRLSSRDKNGPDFKAFE